MAKKLNSTKRSSFMLNAAAGALAVAMFATPSQAIVSNDNFTPTDIIDETGANGVGMFFRNDGFVCSGTLINPRTVLFGVITGSGVWKNLKYGACLAEIVFVWKSKEARGARHTWQKIL